MAECFSWEFGEMTRNYDLQTLICKNIIRWLLLMLPKSLTKFNQKNDKYILVLLFFCLFLIKIYQLNMTCRDYQVFQIHSEGKNTKTCWTSDATQYCDFINIRVVVDLGKQNEIPILWTRRFVLSWPKMKA